MGDGLDHVGRRSAIRDVADELDLAIRDVVDVLVVGEARVEQDAVLGQVLAERVVAAATSSLRLSPRVSIIERSSALAGSAPSGNRPIRHNRNVLRFVVRHAHRPVRALVFGNGHKDKDVQRVQTVR